MIPAVSVVIPVYNTTRFLPACIESLLAQTLEDIELIFVDDASTDDSWAILQTYQAAHPDRIKTIHLEQNVRQGGARNVGIRAARAEYIGFVDSDDLVLPQMFEELYAAASQHDSDVVFCRYVSVPESFHLGGDMPEEPSNHWTQALYEMQDRQLTDEDRAAILLGPVGGVPSGLWKKSLIVENDCFFPERMRWEDNYWGALIVLYLNRIHILDNIYYFYRQQHTSTTHTIDRQSVEERAFLERKLLEKVKEIGVFGQYRSIFEYIYTVRYVFSTAKMATRLLPDSRTFILNIVDDLKKNIPKVA